MRWRFGFGRAAWVLPALLLATPAAAQSPQPPAIVVPPVLQAPVTEGAATASGQVGGSGLLSVPLTGAAPATTALPAAPKAPASEAPAAQTEPTTGETKLEFDKPVLEPDAGSAQTASATSGSDSSGAQQGEVEKTFLKAQEASMNGSFIQRLPVAVPAFRGLEPRLALVYDSNAGVRPTGATAGMLGLSWRLEGLSEIVRASRVGGAPRFDSTDVYLLDGDELVICTVQMQSPSCTAGGSHTTRVESYRRIIFDTPSNTWMVTARDGTAYQYHAVGTFPYSSTPDPAITSNYRWLLKTITDRHGNVVTYSYDCGQLPVCWPGTIAYNGTEIAFKYETRPDPLTYGTGKSIATADKRVRTIDIKTGGARVRAYALLYQVSTPTGLSRLSTVTPFGRDAVLDASGFVTAGAMLPPTVLTSANDLTTSTASTYSDLGKMTDLVNGNLYSYFIGDFNGDGRRDIGRSKNGQCKQVRDSDFEDCGQIGLLNGIFWGTSSGLSSQTITVTDPGPENNCGWCSIYLTEIFYTKDFDGDGKDDLVRTRSYKYLYYVGTSGDPDDDPEAELWFDFFKSTGSSFVHSGSVSVLKEGTSEVEPPIGFDAVSGDFDGDGRADVYFDSKLHFISATGTWLSKTFTGPGRVSADGLQFLHAGDFNGDGKTDIINVKDGKLYLSSGAALVHVATGSAWLPSPYLSPEKRAVVIADFNGDGLADGASTDLSGNVSIHISTGRGFVSSTWGSVSAGHGLFPGDLNGDGRTDLIGARIGNGLTGSATSYRELISKGSSFVVTTKSAPPMPVALADFNGDGRGDIIQVNSYTSSPSASLVQSTGTNPDLLVSVKNRYGGTTQASYAPSSAWVNDKLPFVIQTVSAVKQDNGLGALGTTYFGYSGGFYDAVERRFLGFRNAAAVLPCNPGETVCPERHYTFRQDVASAGALETLEYWTGPKPPAPNAGVMLRKDVETWVVNTNPLALPYKAQNTASEVNEYDGGVTRTRRTERTLDAHNNVIELKELGDVATAADDKRLTRVFLPNVANYIVDRPAAEVQHRADGSVLAERRFSYDGAADWNQAVGPRGDVTKIDRWLDLPPPP